jgi:TIR domain/inactive STAND
MAEVFISYSSSNRTKVLQILGELQALGIDCWLDKNKIPGGSNWSQEIVVSIRKCRLFLLMASPDSLKSENVSKELQLAAHYDKPILPVWLVPDLTYTDQFAYHLTATQYIAATDEFPVWKEHLLQAFRLAKVTIPEAADSAVKRTAINVATKVLPYLANRLQQERCIYQELERHLREQPHRPIAFIAHGEREPQCLTGFIQRLWIYTLPRHLRRLDLSDQLEWKYVPWPQPIEGARNESLDQRTLMYSTDIRTGALELPVSAKPDALVRRITNFRKAVAFCSTICGEYWRPEEPALIRNVLDFWSKLPALPNNQPVIIFLAIGLQQVDESLFSRWFAHRAPAKIPAVLDALRQGGGIDLDIVILPELVDITVPDIEHWVRDVIRPIDPEGMIRQIKHSFKECQLATDKSVSMERLLPLLEAVLPANDRLRGV